MPPSFTAVKLVGKPIEDKLGYRGTPLFFVARSDVILLLASGIHSWEGHWTNSSVRGGSSWRTNAHPQRTWLDGLSLFLKVLRGEASRPPVITPVWKARFSYRETGFRSELAPSSYLSIHDYLQGTSSYVGFWAQNPLSVLVQNYKQPFYLHEGKFHTHAEHLRLFVKYLIDQGGVDPEIMRQYDATAEVDKIMYKGLKLSDTEISYQAVCHHHWYGLADGTGAYVEYDVKIALRDTYFASVTVSNHKVYTMTGGNKASFWFNSTNVSLTTATVRARAVYDSIPYLPNITIRHFLPALYLSQNRAITTILTKVSRNFETMVESPGFVAGLWEVSQNVLPKVKPLKGPRGLISARKAKQTLSGVSRLPYLSRVRWLLNMLASFYLFYVFALSPAMQTLADILSGFIKQNKITTGVGSVVYEGTSISYNDIPQGLANVLRGLCLYPAHYKVVVRSHLRIIATGKNTSEVLTGFVELIAGYGFLPTPTQLWASQPWTWAIDTFLPMSTLISAMENRVKALFFNFSRIGHSVLVEIDTIDGRRIDLFIRSDEANGLVDPQNDLWIKSSDVSPEVKISLFVTRFF